METPAVNAETNGCEDRPANLTTGGRERIVVAIKSAPPEFKTGRHAKRHKKNSTSSSSSPSPSPKKVVQERRATRNSPSIASPVVAEKPVVEKRTLKITVSNSTNNKKVEKIDKNIPEKNEKNEKSEKSEKSEKIEKNEKVEKIEKNGGVSPPISSPPTPITTKTSKSSIVTSSSSSSNSTPGKRKARAKSPLTSSSSRASKRPRHQYQPYQSPAPLPGTQFPTFKPSAAPKVPDDKIIMFNKGEFLAVRNENGGFYVCRTAQNVYKSSRRFKIQWLNSSNNKDIYSPDFYDTTDFECVLTNLRMKRVDKNKFLLPDEESKRTMNILQRALNVESGMDKPDPHKVTVDGVDVSMVGKKEEQELVKIQRSLENKAGKIRIKKEDEPPIKKIKISELVAKEEDKLVKSPSSSHSRKRHSEKLRPNLEITVVEKDPTFETNIQIPFVSSTAHSRLLIRAILMKDLHLLKSLINDTQNICTLSAPRSISIDKTPFDYAVLLQNHKAIKLLLSAEKKKYASAPAIMLTAEGTGRYNTMMLGHSTRPISTGRGGKEGNAALIKDVDHYFTTYPEVTEELIIKALRKGVSLATIKLITNSKTGEDNNDIVYLHIVEAIRYGHYNLAGQLVNEVLEKGGYGFNILHKEVLLNNKQKLSKFRSVSAIKKATENARITPLHCAAINPNIDYLVELLGSAPEYNLADRDGWMPIHYAATCTHMAPLELLISRGISIDEVNTRGNTPLHVACIAGRPHNVKLILAHGNTIYDQNKTEENNVILSLYDKFGVGGVDRPNQKTFTPLLCAVFEGHLDVVKVLLKNDASIEKPTGASQEKLTPLMLAAQQGHFQIANELVNQGAIVEATDKRQRTALTHAVINGNTHIASYLLRLGADPNTKDSSGHSLVHYACAYGWHFCLQLLIEAGASPNLANNWKLVPLSVAFMKGHIGLVNFLVEQPGVDVSISMNDETGMTMVMQAVRVDRVTYTNGVLNPPINSSMVERLKFLIEKLNSSCSTLDYMGNTALHYLVHTETLYISSLSHMEHQDNEGLADKQAQGRALSEADWDGLLEEIKQEHDASLEEVVHLLLKNGCKPHLKNEDGESAFTLAIKQGCLAIVKVFLSSGCELSFTTNSNTENTVLHYLVSQAGNVEVDAICHSLLQAATHPPSDTALNILNKMANHYNKNGFTPLLLALNKFNERGLKIKSKVNLISYIKFLLESLSTDITYPLKNDKDQVVGSALHTSVGDKEGLVAKLLLSKRPPLDPLDLESRTPLVASIVSGNVEVAQQLIIAGANLSVKSPKDDNLPPLLLACRRDGMGKVVQLLIQNKAPLHVIDNKTGNTALHYLVSNYKKDNDTVRLSKSLLLGIDVNAANIRNQTPLHLSVANNSSGTDAFYGVEELLLANKARPDMLDTLGRTPLHYSLDSSNEQPEQKDPIELVNLLVSHMTSQSVSIQDTIGQTPLHLAAICGATVTAMHLMQKMSTLELKDKDGNTALSLAILNDHQSTVLVMLQKNASCIGEVVILPPNKTKFHPEDWVWDNLVKPPTPPIKHTILQEAVKRDWQAVVYIMLDQLEAMGKGLSVAIEAALQTSSHHLAIKLVSRVKHSWTLYTDKHSTLHLLAMQKDVSPMQLQVATTLIEKGVPPLARDEHGASVLTYAAINWNAPLFNYFVEKVGLLSVVQADPDKSLRTPLSAFFWKIDSTDFPEDVKECCRLLIQNGANTNILTQYSFQESSYPGVRLSLLDGELHQEGGSFPRMSPIVVAIYKRNYSVVKFLLESGVDLNFKDDLHRTAIMHAARLQDLKMIKLLLNPQYNPEKDTNSDQGSFKQTSDVDLNLADLHGYTVIHHAINPSTEYSFNNKAIVNFLVVAGAPLDIPNNDGDTPLNMCLKSCSYSMVELLYDWLNVPPDERTLPPRPAPISTFPGVDPPTWTIKDDYEKSLETFETSSESKESPTLPDKHSDLIDLGTVIIDSTQDVPYDILLTCVDLRYKTGLYNFYKMQLIKHKAKNLILLFTRWGRVGDVGQYQKSPFASLEAAVTEFCKIFKSKTGNTWDSVKTFKSNPKKYRLVQLEKRRQPTKNPVLLKLVSDVPSKLSKPIGELFTQLLDVHIKQRSWDHLSLEAKYSNITFGRLPESTLQRAQDILSEIRTLVEKQDLGNYEYTNKIVDLSEEFYHLIPVHGYEYDRLEPLFHSHIVNSMFRLIHDLKHISLAAELLLGSQQRIKEMPSIDYVFRSLGCPLQLLDKQTTEAQFILQYIHNTSGNYQPRVQAIYELSPPGSSTLHTTMLWHGTSASNVLGILKRGLQIAPVTAALSGDSFGKGIYFSDSFEKSLGYCGNQNNSFIFLCEVSLEKMKEGEKLTKKEESSGSYNSVKVAGRCEPDPVFSVSHQGVVWPLGPKATSANIANPYLEHSEYVVLSPSQVHLRFLVHTV